MATRLVAALLVPILLAAVGAAVLVLARDRVLALVTDGPGAGRAPVSSTVLSVDGRTWTAGTRGPGSDRSVDGSERFRIGSVTKTFVATVVLQLVDEGRVELDAPVETYLPGVVPDGGAITVRQVLQHTSGIPDYMRSEGWSTNRWRGVDRFRDHTPDELLREAFTHPSSFAPGTAFRYSNTNFVAGLLVEGVTGRPYGTEVGDRSSPRSAWPGRRSPVPTHGCPNLRPVRPRSYPTATGSMRPSRTRAWTGRPGR